ncbi:MAG: hypothetical protein M1832_003020 [Thelocarpon impressellum]|nr:MAG: hypothetical protein M1832_003020 [Thelocarpon impressellum]
MPPPSRQSEEAASTPPNSSSSYGPYYRNGFSMDSPAEAMSTPGLSDCDSDLSSVSTTPTLTPASVRFPSTLPRMVTWSTREPSISEIAEEATAAASNSSARALGLCPPPSDDAAIDNLRHSLKCQLSSGELDPPIVAQFARYERDISRVRKLLLRSAADRSPSDMRWVGRVAVTMLTGFGAAGRDLRGQMRWLEMVRPHLPNLRAITSNMILDTAWRVWHRMLQPMKLLPDEDATLYTTFAELYDSTLPRALTLGQPVLAALSPTIEAVAAAAARLRAARHAMCEEMIFVEQRLLADPATCERIHAVRRVQESIDHGKGRMVSDGGWSDVSTIGSDTATAEPPLPEAGDGGGQGQAKFAHALEALALDKAMHGSPGLSPQD